MSSDLPASSNNYLSFISRFPLKAVVGLSLLGSTLVILFLYWFFSWQWQESTDNAYIKSGITPISSKVNGYVIELNVTEGDEVKKGQVIAKIDPQEYQAHYDKAQQDLESAEAALQQLPVQLEMQTLGLSKVDLQMESRQAILEKDERAYDRSKSLYKSDISSVRDYDMAKANYIGSKVDLAQSEVSKKILLQHIQLTKLNIIKQTAVVEALKEQLKLMKIAWDDTEIIAPIAGVIGNRSIRKGQYIRTGSILLSIVPLDDIWIIANYKETQVGRFSKGQTVKFTVDTYPGETFQGKILSVNPASGAEFSMIPPENATGNFTKIVQRIPVKISIESAGAYRLVPGMSVATTVNTKNL